MDTSVFNPDYQNQHLESRIVVALERISEAFRVLLWYESKVTGLSPIQIQIMIFLYFHEAGRRKVSYLAQEFNMTKPTISDAIKVLEQKQLIYKETESEDSRSYIIHLTDKGIKVAQKTVLFANGMQHPFAQMTTEQKEILWRSLLELIYKLQQAGIIQLQRMCFTCRFYGKAQEGHDHFCNLLRIPLYTANLRIDCPEHSPVG